MLPPLYLHAAAAISPQHTFERQLFLDPAIEVTDGKLYVLDPDYRQYINPVAIRRMSRLLKMGISAALHCLRESRWATPDAIITGTGRGSLADMESFLKDLIRLEEGALNPTLFIQSTYNAPNGWIALQSRSTGYNQTFVHRGHSFELALLDAGLHLAETSPDTKVLVGCYDELSEEYYLIKARLRYWRKDPSPSLSLLATRTQSHGTIAGEGAAFFALSGKREGACLAILHLALINNMEGDGFPDALHTLLMTAGIGHADIDVIIAGRSGDNRMDALYDPLETSMPGAAVLHFKHLCGEYDTASGFALWLAHWLCTLKGDVIPDILLHRAGGNPGRAGQYFLLANHYMHGTGSLLLLKRLQDHNAG